MLTNSRVVAIAFVVFILARVSIEVVRVASASQSDPPLAWAYLINTLSVIALVVALTFLLRWWGDTETVKRHIAMESRLHRDERLIVVGKDKALMNALGKVLPDAPEDFWKARAASFLFSIVASSEGLYFWFGGREPSLAGTIPARKVRSVTVGSGLRMARNYPAVLIEVATSEGLVLLPMIVSEKAPRTFLPVKAERAQAIALDLGRLLSESQPT